MEINRLSKDELTYELRIRGIKEESTVDVMRQVLRMALKLEKQSSFVAPSHPFSFAEDKTAIEEKIVELSALIETFAKPKTSTTFKRISSKLSHLYSRVSRCVPKTEEETAERSVLLGSVLSLCARLSAKAKSAAKMSSTQIEVSSQLVPSSEDSEESEDDQGLPSPSAHSTRVSPNPSSTNVVIPVSRWNLKFSGDLRGMSINAFLERAEELRVARGVSYETLFSSTIDLLEGHALVWFRANRRKIHSWHELCLALREEFQPVDYDEKLLDEVKRRTQGIDEPIGIYLAVMTNLFARFNTPVPEQLQLKILRRNILPYFQAQLGLVDVPTVGALLYACRRLEANRTSIEAYIPPPSRIKSLEPDLAYMDVSPSVSAVEPVKTQRKCWNCGEIGHLSIVCRAPKRRHCYRCGKPHVTVNTCPACSKNLRRPQ